MTNMVLFVDAVQSGVEPTSEDTSLKPTTTIPITAPQSTTSLITSLATTTLLEEITIAISTDLTTSQESRSSTSLRTFQVLNGVSSPTTPSHIVSTACPGKNKSVCLLSLERVESILNRSYPVSNALSTNAQDFWPGDMPLIVRTSNRTEPPKHWIKGPIEAKAAAAVGSMFIFFVIGEIALMIACDARLLWRQCKMCQQNIRSRCS